ncbi:T-lymphocyte activation antigen CD80, partial [Ophiophagus hannah]
SLSQELRVVVQAGDEARLPCRYKIDSGTLLDSYYIYWQKDNSDKQDLVVISYKNGKEVESEKDKSYKNRTKLEEQNLILSIASVTVNDIPFSTPIILNNSSGEHCDSKNLTLMCLSYGGSSEPKMYGSINENPVNWTVTSNEIFGRFNITGILQLNMTENILIRCSVHYLDFQVSSNYSLNLHSDFELQLPDLF